MFFSHKPTNIVYVERSRLLLFPKTPGAPLALPEEVFRNLELRDPKKLADLLAAYAAQRKLRGKRLLVALGKDIVFQKAITLEKGADTEALRKDFEDKVPFAAGDRQVISVRQKDRLFLFGTNMAFYQAIVSAFEGAGAKIVATAPAMAYGLTEFDKLSEDKFTQIAKASRLTAAANFLIN
jgi:hypothetical protein